MRKHKFFDLSIANESRSPLAFYVEESIRRSLNTYLDLYGPLEPVIEGSEIEEVRLGLVTSGAAFIANPSNYTIKYRKNLMEFARDMIYHLRASEEFAEGENVP